MLIDNLIKITNDNRLKLINTAIKENRFVSYRDICSMSKRNYFYGKKDLEILTHLKLLIKKTDGIRVYYKINRDNKIIKKLTH